MRQFLQEKENDFFNTETIQERILRKTFNYGTETYTLVKGGKDVNPETNHEIYLSLIILTQILIFDLISNVYKRDPSSRFIKETLLNDLHNVSIIEFKDLNQPSLNINNFDFSSRLFAKVSYLFGKAPISLLKTEIKRKSDTESTLLTSNETGEFVINFLPIDISKTSIASYTTVIDQVSYCSVEKYLQNLPTFNVLSSDNNKRMEYKVSFTTSYYYLPVLINRNKAQKRTGLWTANHCQSDKVIVDDELYYTPIKFSEITTGFSLNECKCSPYLVFGRYKKPDSTWVEYCIITLESETKDKLVSNDKSNGNGNIISKSVLQPKFLEADCKDSSIAANSEDIFNDYLNNNGTGSRIYISDDPSCKSPIYINRDNFLEPATLSIFASTITTIIYLTDKIPNGC